MLIIFECDRIIQVKPGSFKSTLGDKTFRRWWYLWFAVAIWPGDLEEYGEACKDATWVWEGT